MIFNKYIIYFVVFILCLIPSIGIAQAFGLELPPGKKKLRIPFTLENNLIVLDLMLNDSVPGRFILDTGSKYNLLTDKNIVDVLGLEYEREVTILGADRRMEITAHIVRNVNFFIRGLKGIRKSFIVLEEDILNFNDFLGVKIQGILGTEIFQRYIVKINYIGEELILYDRKYFKNRKLRSYQPIDLKLSNQKMAIEGLVLNEEGTLIEKNFLLDSGASTALLFLVDENSEIQTPEKSIVGELGRGLGGNLQGAVGRIPFIQIGSFQFREVLSSFQSDTASLILPGLDQREGIIGGELLRRFSVYLDFFNKKLYLKKNSYYKEPFEYDMSGLVLKPRKKFGEPLVIDRVLPSSPAQLAGIKKGDQILKINGRWRNLSSSVIYKILRSGENNLIRIKIKRNGETTIKYFKLRKII